MHDLTRGLPPPSRLALVRARELEVEIEVTQPSIVIDSALLGEMMRTDGFGIVADVIHDPTLEVELEVVFDASAGWPLVSDIATSVYGATRSPTDVSSVSVVFDSTLSDLQEPLGDEWFLASEEIIAAVDAVWPADMRAPRFGLRTRLALIGAVVVGLAAAFIAAL